MNPHSRNLNIPDHALACVRQRKWRHLFWLCVHSIDWLNAKNLFTQPWRGRGGCSFSRRTKSSSARLGCRRRGRWHRSREGVHERSQMPCGAWSARTHNYSILSLRCDRRRNILFFPYLTETTSEVQVALKQAAVSEPLWNGCGKCSPVLPTSVGQQVWPSPAVATAAGGHSGGQWSTRWVPFTSFLEIEFLLLFILKVTPTKYFSSTLLLYFLVFGMCILNIIATYLATTRNSSLKRLHQSYSLYFKPCYTCKITSFALFSQKNWWCV